MHGIQTYENENCNDVQMSMDTLNLGIAKEQDKYTYTGQSLHSLTHAYYTNNYDKQIMSKCSPQVYDMLTSKANFNSPLLECYKDKGETAFDVNKQYTNILTKCDSYGWAIYIYIYR